MHSSKVMIWKRKPDRVERAARARNQLTTPAVLCAVRFRELDISEQQSDPAQLCLSAIFAPLTLASRPRDKYAPWVYIRRRQPSSAQISVRLASWIWLCGMLLMAAMLWPLRAP